jgi:hypothetical protein
MYDEAAELSRDMIALGYSDGAARLQAALASSAVPTEIYITVYETLVLLSREPSGNCGIQHRIDALKSQIEMTLSKSGFKLAKSSF